MPTLAGISTSCGVGSAEMQPPAHMHPTPGATSGARGAAAGEGGGSVEEGGFLKILLCCFLMCTRACAAAEKSSPCGGFSLWPLFSLPGADMSICRAEGWMGCRGWSGWGAAPSSLRHLELSVGTEILPGRV